MTRPHFTEDFKRDAIKQITELGYSVADASKRLGVSTHSLYAWMKRFLKPAVIAEAHLSKLLRLGILNKSWHVSQRSVTF